MVTPDQSPNRTAPALGAIGRGVYDLAAAQLPALPSANDEARSVGATFGPSSTVLLGDSATELELKRAAASRLQRHPFCSALDRQHEIPGAVGTASPACCAEDGLFQAREILTLRLAADLVTLSACDTGSGTVHGGSRELGSAIPCSRCENGRRQSVDCG